MEAKEEDRRSTFRADSATIAAAAASRTGVHIRELSHGREMDAVADLLTTIWKSDPKQPHISPSLMKAMAHSGNYVVGAYREERLVGACIGFFAEPLGQSLHSHIAGVSHDFSGRGVGSALKLHQKAWCLRRGLSEITWTYDPLVARNAYFNLRILGAQPTEYLVDFYGLMPDEFNAGQPTDRLLLRWDLNPTIGQPVLAGSGAFALENIDGEPVVHAEAGDQPHTKCRIQVPSDIALLRIADMPSALRWRAALRDVLTTLMSSGWSITDFDRTGFYTLERI